MDLDTLQGYPQPWALNVHEPAPGLAQGVRARYLSGQDIPRGYEWFARGTAVYGGGSAIDVPIAIAGDSFYFLPTHEINAGVCVIAYRMDKAGKGGDRGPEPKESLTDEQWSTPSLCAGWSVHQGLAHIVATAKMTSPRFVVRYVRAGFNFSRFNERNIAEEMKPTPVETLAEFRVHLTDTKSPPGPDDSWIGEIVIHAADLRRPLGIESRTPVEVARRVADFYKNSNVLIGAKSRIAGLTLTASDIAWTTGSGPEANGPILSLVQAMTGRGAAVDDLSGPGASVLRSRITDAT